MEHRFLNPNIQSLSSNSLKGEKAQERNGMSVHGLGRCKKKREKLM